MSDPNDSNDSGLTRRGFLVATGELRQPDYWGQAHLDLMQKYRRRMIAVYLLRKYVG
jgi:hypothetical protein